MPTLDRDGEVLVLDLGDDENRFHPDWLAEVGALLDEAQATQGPAALVLSATGKYYSNGLDLEWLQANGDRREDYLASAEGLFARVLSYPMVTVAAIQGHAFAAGAMLSLSQDLRVMRADRGFWCLPEVDLGMPFPPGMASLIQSRLAPQTAHVAMVTGLRFGGEDALAAGIVDRAVPEAEVLPTAVELARPHVGKHGANLAGIKERMYGTALAHLRREGAR